MGRGMMDRGAPPGRDIWASPARPPAYSLRQGQSGGLQLSSCKAELLSRVLGKDSGVQGTRSVRRDLFGEARECTPNYVP